ncbi:MAG: hypothetical protein ABMB14_20290 [Myxococcota bacterium]
MVAIDARRTNAIRSNGAAVRDLSTADTEVEGIRVVFDNWTDDVPKTKPTELPPKASPVILAGSPLTARGEGQGPVASRGPAVSAAASPAVPPRSRGRSWGGILALVLVLAVVIGGIVAVSGVGALVVAGAAAAGALLYVPMVEVRLPEPPALPRLPIELVAPPQGSPSAPAKPVAPPVPGGTEQVNPDTSDAELVVMPDPGVRTGPVDKEIRSTEPSQDPSRAPTKR